MMNIATTRFAPLIGILVLLVLVALAGSTLSHTQKPPAIGPASASIALSETAPRPVATTSAVASTTPPPAPEPEAPAPPPPAPQQQQPQPVPQEPAAPAAIPTPEVIVPQQPLVYDDFDDADDLDFDHYFTCRQIDHLDPHPHFRLDHACGVHGINLRGLSH